MMGPVGKDSNAQCYFMPLEALLSIVSLIPVL